MANYETDVVILAAGNGLRLSSLSPLPKPLVTIDARPMLDRVLGALAALDFARVKIVVGHHADSIRGHAFPSANGIEVDWIENPRYDRPNGISLLAAEGHVHSPFVLLMADHLFETATLEQLMRQPCPADGAVLAVDRKIDAVFDLPDATKVVTRASRLQAIDKYLASYDAIDTGMFLCSEAIFAAMRSSVIEGRESLSDGIRTLAGTGGVVTWDIGPAAWIDVDTPGARDEAERMVRAGCFETTRRTPGSPSASSAPRRTDCEPRRAPLASCDGGDLAAGRG